MPKEMLTYFFWCFFNSIAGGNEICSNRSSELENIEIVFNASIFS